MRIALTASAIALAMAGMIGTTSSASAATAYSFSINRGDIAFAYNDGYWDRTHNWHDWTPADARYYRGHYKTHYYAQRHDKVRDGGWHKQWWKDSDHDGVPNAVDRHDNRR